jgi:hypothetical protein
MHHWREDLDGCLVAVLAVAIVMVVIVFMVDTNC